MIKEMNLKISGFGPINNADINLKKLNIIAGKNESGKSTSSKLLYCFLAANSKEGIYLANKSIHNKFMRFIFHWNEYFKEIGLNEMNIFPDQFYLDNLRDLSYNEQMQCELKNIDEKVKLIDFKGKNKFFNELNSIKQLLTLNQNRHHRYYNVTNVLLNAEFNFNEIILNDNANVNFYGVNDECEFYHELDFKNDKIGAKISSDYTCLSFDNVIYIDAPSIFDFNNLLKFNSKSSPNHLKLLSNQINNFRDKSDVYDSEYNEKIIRFHEKFKKLLNGLIYYDSDKEDFIYKKRNQKYSMKNTASGVKQLGVLQVLLENRILKEDSFLIIDEVEVNLHPEWQLKLAEILVLLARDLDIYVYINSHSPQFIEALEVYSGKYGLVNDSKFYLSEISDDRYDFKEVQRENLAVLYDNLGESYNIIDEIRGENLSNGIF